MLFYIIYYFCDRKEKGRRNPEFLVSKTMDLAFLALPKDCLQYKHWERKIKIMVDNDYNRRYL